MIDYIKNNNWLKKGIYFSFGFLFIWSFLHVIIYFFIGAHTLSYLEIYPWLIFISPNLFSNLFYFFLWGVVIGLIDTKLKNKGKNDYVRISTLLSIFLIGTSLIFLFRSVSNSIGLEGLTYIVVGVAGMLGGLFFPWILSPLIIIFKQKINKYPLFKFIILIAIILIILTFVSIQSFYKFSYVIKTMDCQDIQEPRKILIDSQKLFEDYLIETGIGLPNRTEVLIKYALKNNLSFETMETEKDPELNIEGVSAAQRAWGLAIEEKIDSLSKNESKTSEIYQKEVSRINLLKSGEEILAEISWYYSKKSTPLVIRSISSLSDAYDRGDVDLNMLNEYIRNVCVPDEARIFVMALLRNRMAYKELLTPYEKKMILINTKNSVPYLKSTQSKYKADDIYLMMRYYSTG